MNDCRLSGDPTGVDRVKRQMVGTHLSFVRRCVGSKVPASVIEDVSATCVESALRSRFNGTTEAEFRAWLRRIASRRVVDYYRRRDACVSLEVVSPSAFAAGEDIIAATDTGAVIGQQVMALKAKHREVVLRYLVAGEPASDITRVIPGMTVGNVHKIVERFRKSARASLNAEVPHAQ